MRKTSLVFALLSLVLVPSLVLAGNGSGVGADPYDSIEVSGPVLAVTGGSGSGLPMITVDDELVGPIDIGLGPIWFLQAGDFSVAVDDRVSLLAYACPICAVSYVAAWVVNDSNGTSIDLRDEDGRPLWIQRQHLRGGSGRPGQGNGSGGQNGGGSGSGSGSGQPGGSGNGTGSGPSNGSGLDMSLIDTVTGEVVDFVGHAGAGQPLLTLDVDGEVYEITVSPYAPIEAAGMIIEPGVALTVVFAPTECEEYPHFVTVSILDVATGVLVQLRDPETGFPMTTGGGHHRPNWP